MANLRDFKSTYMAARKVRVKSLVVKNMNARTSVTLPSGTVTDCTEDVLTNKTILTDTNEWIVDGADVSGDLSVDSVTATGRVDGSNIPTGTLIDVDSAQTFTDKTINSSDNSLSITSGTVTATSMTVTGAVTAGSLVSNSLTTTADYLTIGTRHQRFEATHSFTLTVSPGWSLTDTPVQKAQYLGRFSAGQSVHLYIQTNIAAGTAAKVFNIVLHVQESTVRIVNMTCSDTGTLTSEIRVYSDLSGTASDIWLDYYHVDTTTVTCEVVGDCYSFEEGDSNYLLPTDPQDVSTTLDAARDWKETVMNFSNAAGVVATNFNQVTDTAVVGHNVFGNMHVEGELAIVGTGFSGAVSASSTDTLTNKVIITENHTPGTGNVLAVPATNMTGNLTVENVTTGTMTIGAVVLDSAATAYAMIYYDGDIDNVAQSMVMSITTPGMLTGGITVPATAQNCTVATDRITVGLAGTYRVCYRVSVNPDVGTRQAWAIYKNGVHTSFSDRLAGSSGVTEGVGTMEAVSGSTMVVLSLNDYIQVGGVIASGTVTNTIPAWNLSVERMHVAV